VSPSGDTTFIRIKRCEICSSAIPSSEVPATGRMAGDSYRRSSETPPNAGNLTLTRTNTASREPKLSTRNAHPSPGHTTENGSRATMVNDWPAESHKKVMSSRATAVNHLSRRIRSRWETSPAPKTFPRVVPVSRPRRPSPPAPLPKRERGCGSKRPPIGRPLVSCALGGRGG